MAANQIAEFTLQSLKSTITKIQALPSNWAELADFKVNSCYLMSVNVIEFNRFCRECFEIL